MPASKLLPALAAALFLAACQAPATTPTPATSAAPAASAVNLAAPPAGEGVQITIGPFDVPAGQEVQNNFYLKLPYDQDVMVERIQVAYPTGSHHLNLFKSEEARPDGVEATFAAVDYQKYQMFAASQTGAMDWKLPAGVGIPFKKQQQLLFQTHWVNATTQKTPSGKGEAKVNLWFAKPGTATTNLGMAFIINKNLDILPKTETKSKKIVDFKRQGYDKDVEILAMTGHFHSRGKAFEVNRYDGTSPGAELYRSDNWDEPPFTRFEKPLAYKAGEKLLYTATFVNNSDMVIKFGPQVEIQEHSNLFMYFTPGPADGKAIYDVDGLP